MSQTLATLKATSFPPASGGPLSSVETVLEKLVALVRADIAHGHFEISVSGEDGKAGCTSLIITAGKKFKFLVPKQQ
jgi:hypothetical protein